MATSGITFSGFNDIDFNVVLNAIMDQESQPLTALQSRQSELKKIDTNYTTLVSKLGTLRSNAAALSSPTTFARYSASSSDTAAVTAAGSTGAVPGRYEIVVNELARGQVTVSASTASDLDTTAIATGGTLTIGSQVVTLSGATTLQGLAALINADSDGPATASIVQTSPGTYRLALSSKETGAANAFTIQNQLTGATLAFTDTDNDNISGDSAADNAVSASDASALINNIPVTSTTNTLSSAVPGVSVTLLEKNPAKTVVVSVTRDDGDLADRVDAFVAAYNDIVKFAGEQARAAATGTAGTLGRETLLRTLKTQLRDTLAGAHGGGTLTHLAEVGLGFNQTGQLTFDRAALSTAVAANPSAVQSLFTNPSTGAFKAVNDLVDAYVTSGGFVRSARTRVSDQLTRLSTRIDDMTARLAVRRRTLQAQFIAADRAMTTLKGQQSALSSFAKDINTPLK
ncbi:MAG: flagellar filament capping protein FliD [Vicinamibacterales bacterium]